MIERIASKQEMRAAVAAARKEGKRVGLVPTMGALHEGHLSLVRTACERTDLVVVSIFVNPTQFGPGEDFERYPRRIEEDLALLAADGVELVFTPSTDEMYGADAQVSVEPGPLAARWEGAVRPGHFAGVATVVTKLLSVVRPDLAFFGEKDYQQLQVVRRLVNDLDLGVGVVGVPIVRDSHGLALSSRNAYLSPAERTAALSLSRALRDAAAAASAGERDAAALEERMRAALDAAVALDYSAVVDADSLEPLARLERPARALLAGRVGATRLIDNIALIPGGSA